MLLLLDTLSLFEVPASLLSVSIPSRKVDVGGVIETDESVVRRDISLRAIEMQADILFLLSLFNNLNVMK